ncbi:peroxisomal membrane protein PEX14 [Stomoxys calcitrans]|uniref:Peroxisomal membrane protein PEX14 n=1 Tax=Stomoxys calcitrans TaxID=35570 RepID=A0A1I8NPZ4_STOCA|nr:peroxisomal membrane protein PEX14 [Stomoxys calcitrans]
MSNNTDSVLFDNTMEQGNNEGCGEAGCIEAPREALITTAVNFLTNSKVRHTTLVQKQQFLRSKGLTEKEIQMACERAGVFTQDPNAPTVINMGINATQTHAQLAIQPMRTTALGRLKEILHSMALLGGVAYAIYAFWKKFLEPFLFGNKKKKTTDEALSDIDQKVDTRIGEVKTELTQVKESLAREQRDQTQQFMREFNQFKSDLEAIKGLLLNRKQFASPLVSGVVGGPASIPAWQLSSSSPHHLRHHKDSQSDDNEKNDDVGSGSGSSETEVVTKNSDSSLEIM